MNYDLTISFSEPTWQLLAEQAAVTGTPPQAIVETAVQEHLAKRTRRKPKAEMTEQEKEEARRRFRACIGSVSMGTGADNESIDRDLAREYGNNHEPK